MAGITLDLFEIYEYLQYIFINGESKLSAHQSQIFQEYKTKIWGTSNKQDKLSIIKTCIVDNDIDPDLLLAYYIKDEYEYDWYIIIRLLQNGANVNLISGNSNVLYSQAIFSMWDNMRLLINKYDALGCYTTISDKRGDMVHNILYFAAYENQMDIVKALLENGAYDHPCWDKNGDGIIETSAMCARRNGHLDVAKYIENFPWLQGKRIQSITISLCHILPVSIIDNIIEFSLWTNDHYGPIVVA